MFIAVLTLDFHLHGCSSLKGKRQRLKGLTDRFGGQRHIAVCESNHANAISRAEISFVATATSKTVVESSLAKVVNHCRANVDAELLHHEITWL